MYCPTCKSKHKDIHSFETHMRFKHAIQKIEKEKDHMLSCKCPFCNEAFNEALKLISHLSSHAIRGGIKYIISYKILQVFSFVLKGLLREVNCFIGTCDFKSTSVASIKSHYYQIHKKSSNEATENINTLHDHSYFVAPTENCTTSSNEIETNETVNSESEDIVVRRDYHEYYLRYFVQLKDQMMLPESTAKKILADIIAKMIDEQESMKDDVLAVLREDDVKQDTIEKVEKLYNNLELQLAAFKLSSLYRIKKILSNDPQLVLPIELATASNLKAYYVPIKDNLISVLRNNSFFEKLVICNAIEGINIAIQDNNKNDTTKDALLSNKTIIYKSFNYGTHCLNSKFYKEKTNVIELILYFDEYNPCDSVGKSGSDKKHSLFTIL